MLNSNDPKYCNFLRLSPILFEKLLEIVGPKIQKQYAVREPIPPRTRLELTLRYLSSGDSMASVSYAFCVGNNTTSKIISETCQCIWDELQEKVFLNPTAENWQMVAKDFEEQWNYPNCIGALDGKHVKVEAPPNSGSTYYNYKGDHSINLMAISDAKYSFLLLDIGTEGRQSDGGVFRKSAFTETESLRENSQYAQSQYAVQVREHYTDFFMNTGAVDWQWDKVLSNDF
ncbi:uncharacterized protein LOC112637208 [Camponotus floridanus]|uniref:uncharacterized protein LOC112637208 n=1 Tax=Camponotus floridanus TaxID=104421 RepID=UPI000DC6B07B|nr:uncharacterized protein LOC112637208 [Camponotus floridanus]